MHAVIRSSSIVLAFALAAMPAARAQQAAPAQAQPAAVPQFVDTAIATAQGWLAMIDANQFAQSWNAGAPMLKQASPQQAWSSYLAQVRATHGRTLDRQWVNVRRVVNPNGVPAGTYLTLHFATRSEKVADGVEQVSLTIQQGRWVPTGYVIIK